MRLDILVGRARVGVRGEPFGPAPSEEAEGGWASAKKTPRSGGQWDPCGVPTYYDASVREPTETWRSLRRRRTSPPIPAGSSKVRADTFRTALEQAEQQFRAAASVDHDSRALNLYYGASQAGRALAAAAMALGGGEWTLNGHGLRCVRLEEIGMDVSTMSVRPNGGEGTSFQRLSRILGSPVPEIVDLGVLWPLLYETTIHAPLGDVLHPPMPVYLRARAAIGAHGVHCASPQLPGGIRATPVEERPPLGDFLARYPALRGWQTSTAAGTEVTWPPGDQGLELQWEPTEDEGRSGHIVGARLTRYRGHEMAFPVIGGMTDTMHPLMAWWIVLYALSMLTRYRPAQWTALIDVDQCHQAVAIEFVLDTALAAIPDLVDEAIDLVAEDRAER